MLGHPNLQMCTEKSKAEKKRHGNSLPPVAQQRRLQTGAKEQKYVVVCLLKWEGRAMGSVTLQANIASESQEGSKRRVMRPVNESRPDERPSTRACFNKGEKGWTAGRASALQTSTYCKRIHHDLKLSIRQRVDAIGLRICHILRCRIHGKVHWPALPLACVFCIIFVAQFKIVWLTNVVLTFEMHSRRKKRGGRVLTKVSLA